MTTHAMAISPVPAGALAVLEWSGETVRVLEHWGMCTKIKPLSGGATREVSTSTPVLPYQPQSKAESADVNKHE